MYFSTVNTLPKRSSTKSISVDKSSRNITTVSNGSAETAILPGASTGDRDYDELYKIAGRVKPLEFDLKLAWQRVAELEKKNSRRTAFDENEMHQPAVSSLRTRSTVTDDSAAQSSASVSVRPNAAELDELYRVSAQVKPLEYDLTQRKIQVKALKQALKDVRRINEKQLVSVRLQAENRSGALYKEKLASQQKLIKSLRTRLSNSLNRKTSNLKLQPPFERVQEQELTSVRQRLAGTQENLTQSERRVAELQKEVGGLNQRLNSRSSELDTLQLHLKESDQRGSLLAGRIKLLDAQVQQIHMLNRELQDRDHVTGTLTAQIKEYQDEISNLKTELQKKHEQLDAQKRTLEKIPALEASVLTSKQGLTPVRDQVSGEQDRQIVSLQRLETTVSDQEKLITELKTERKNAIADKKVLENRQLQLQQALTVANDSASQLGKLRAELAKSKEVEKQLAQAQHKLVKAKQIRADLNRLQSVSIELEKSRIEIGDLNQSLKSARLAVAAGKANDIEVRRLRSEMQSLQSIHDDSTSKVKSLENKIREQQRRIVTNNQLKERVQELESVEADNKLRDRQISELKKRLRDLSKNSRLKSDKPKKQEKKTKSRALPSPLYTAPEEKDDLKKINGIGPVMEKLLNSLGITSFKQVAEFNTDDISTITDAIKAFPGRIERDNWVGGAKEQYAKKYDKV